MRKAWIHMIVFFEIIILATLVLGDSSRGGLERACQKGKEVKDCMFLLEPYASQFEDKDPDKMGYAAISSAVAQVQAMRAYVVRQMTEQETTEQEKSAVKECFGTAGSSDNSLRMASQEFDKMRNAKAEQRNTHRESVVKMIDSAKTDQMACYDSLNKHTDLVGGSVIAEAVRLADRSVQACSLANIFVQ